MRRAIVLATALLFAAGVPAQDAPGAALFKTVKEKVGADKPFSLLVTAKVKDGMADKMIAAAATVAAATLKEKGCKQYDFFRSTEEPNTFYLIEKWDDLPALEAHFKTDHLLAFVGQFGDLLDGAPKLVVATPLTAAK
jgi:quinol monooxygenase YgiN